MLKYCQTQAAASDLRGPGDGDVMYIIKRMGGRTLLAPAPGPPFSAKRAFVSSSRRGDSNAHAYIFPFSATRLIVPANPTPRS